MYELTDVVKRYRGSAGEVRALEGLDMRIDDRAFLAIQGQTGSGKSTLLQLLGGLDRQTSGLVMFDGHDLGGMNEGALARFRAEAFGFIFQSFNLIPTLTARENVETALVPLGIPSSQRRERAHAALAEVGLGARVGHLPGEMSGGEQQRTAIARALVKDPRVILADEPTGNLDQATRDDIVGLLEQLWTERGVTLIVVTHDAWVAARAHTHARLDDGRLIPEALASVLDPLSHDDIPEGVA